MQSCWQYLSDLHITAAKTTQYVFLHHDMFLMCREPLQSDPSFTTLTCKSTWNHYILTLKRMQSKSRHTNWEFTQECNTRHLIQAVSYMKLVMINEKGWLNLPTSHKGQMISYHRFWTSERRNMKITHQNLITCLHTKETVSVCEDELHFQQLAHAWMCGIW